MVQVALEPLGHDLGGLWTEISPLFPHAAVGTGEDFHLDIAAEELRAAIRQLGRITGRVGVEEILDVVFKDFCIGK